MMDKGECQQVTEHWMNDKDIIVLSSIYVNIVAMTTFCITANPTDQKFAGIFFPDILDYFFDFGFGSSPHSLGFTVPGPNSMSFNPVPNLS